MALTARAAGTAAYVRQRGYAAQGVTWTEVCVKRPIANSGGKWSEHAFANAIDFFGPSSSLDLLAADLNLNRGRLNIATLCWDGGDFTAGDNCTTNHDDHVHVDHSPKCGPSITPSSDCAQAVKDCNQHQGLSGTAATAVPLSTKGGKTTIDVGAGGKTPGGGAAGETVTVGGIGLAEKIVFVVAGIAVLGVGVALVVSDVKGQALSKVLRQLPLVGK